MDLSFECNRGGLLSVSVSPKHATERKRARLARSSRGRARSSKSSCASSSSKGIDLHEASSLAQDGKLRTSSKKLVDKYPERFYSSERYSPAEGGQNTKSGVSVSVVKSKSVNSGPHQTQPQTRLQSPSEKKTASGPAHVHNQAPNTAISVQPPKSRFPHLLDTESERKMRQLSLIEQKKLQWAKEREEMNGIWSPWGRPSTSIGPQHTGIVAREELKEISSSSKYLLQQSQDQHGQQSSPLPTTIAMRNSHHQLISNNNVHEEFRSNYNQSGATGGGGGAAPTLTLPSFNFNYYNVEDDHTSGYQSDNGNGVGGGGGGPRSRHNSGTRVQYKNGEDRSRAMPMAMAIPAQMSRSYGAVAAPPPTASAMRSSFAIGAGISDAGYIDEMKEQERALWLRDLKAQMDEQSQRKEKEVEQQRSRWGDKGICVGHFWEPERVLLPPNSADSNPPAWANGYTHDAHEYGHSRPMTSLSHSHSKSQPSLLASALEPQQQQHFLVYTMNQSVGDLRNAAQSANANTFLRGQNVPIDPEELQEKERKRVAALQHQQAILQQIEERQQRLKEERERRARQEALDEQRIREQQLRLLERAEKEKRLKEEQQQDGDGDADGDGGHVQIFTQPPPQSYSQVQSRSRSRHSRADAHPPETPLESVPIAVLNRRQQFRPQNSIDVIDFEHVRNLTSESVQTEAVQMLPRSPRREIGIQTEAGTQTATAEKKPKAKGVAGQNTSAKPTAKPRWGAGGSEGKKPYVKQSEKDPLYQERMNRINSKRRNWLEKKAEEKVHQVAASYSSDFSGGGYASDGRRFSQSSQSSSALPQQGPSRASKTRADIESKKAAAEMLGRQKRQFRQLQEVGEDGDEEATAAIVRRQSQYLDEIDSEYLEKARRRASMPPSTSSDAMATRTDATLTGRQRHRQRRSTSSSPTKIPVAIGSRSRRPSEKVKEISSVDERENLKYEQKQSSSSSTSKSRSSKSKPKAVTKSQGQAVKEVNASQRSSRSHLRQERRAVAIQEEVGSANANASGPRNQSPPVPALMKRIQMGVDPEEFGKMALAYEIPEKANIDSTPPAPAPSPPPVSAALTHRVEKPKAPPPVSFVVAMGQEKDEGEGVDDSPESSHSQSQGRRGERQRQKEPRIEIEEGPPQSPSPEFSEFSPEESPPIAHRPVDSEFSERRRLISSLMTHDDVVEQISAREDELAQTGIIEFSIHLPRRLYSGGSGSGSGSPYGGGADGALIVATRFDGDSEEKVLHCSQPSSPASAAEDQPTPTPMLLMQQLHDPAPAYGYGYSQGYGYGQGYQDPLHLGSAAVQRRAATISWLYANDGGGRGSGRADSDPYILTRLSSLKRGIQHQQVEWTRSVNRSPIASASAVGGGMLPLQLPLQNDYEYYDHEGYESSRRTRHERDRDREAMLLEY